jgi:PAS domain S-box-containing protein
VSDAGVDVDLGAMAAWPFRPPTTIEEGLATLAALAATGRAADDSGAASPARLRPPPGSGRRQDGRADEDSAEHERRVAEARYRTLIEQIPAVTFLASLSDGGQNEIYVSPQIESLLGFTQEEWVSDPVLWYRQTHPDDRDRASVEFASLCLTGQPFRDVVRVLTRSGETVWVDAEARLVRDSEGHLLFLQGVGFDVTDQYRAREAREQLIREQVARAEADRESDRLRKIFSGLPAAIALLRGPDYAVEFVNPVALELAGGNTDIVGKPFREVFTEFHQLSSSTFSEVLASGQPLFSRELRITSPDGRGERFFNVICQPLLDYRGQLLLMHAVEVTVQVRARREVEEALRLRDEFMSIASHELRTPIAALQAQAQLILRRAQRAGQLEPQRVLQAFETMNSQAGRLNRLVNQLLDISRIESGKLELELELADLVSLVKQVVANIHSRSDRHPINLEAPASLEAEIDPLRLEQVVVNLLDNAVKYSPDGGDIHVWLGRTDPGTVALSIRDHGLGIPPDKRGEIFERFYQAHGSGHRSGLGLGLYICRQIVEMHGGSIAAEFPPDGGTRMFVQLPVSGRGAA